ncbi:S-adenosyl-L-methionine-dependent methyltransferase [Aspergillus keveii]|uniref:S-adenosyl-L-methionine-dependent methyltransferase n=1 Tax=Aspergillus keveii TaxID=714993 RepID=A0ABR4G0Z3_9EURO
MDRIAEQVRALAQGADNTTRKTILDSLRDLSLSLETPHDTLQRICYTHTQSALARVGIDLKLFNYLSESSTPSSIDELAAKTGAAPGLLGRILRYLSSMGIIKETAKDTFTPNNITQALAMPAIQSGVYHNFDNIAPAIIALPDFLIKHKYQDITSPTNTPMQVAFNTPDPAFIWVQTRPEAHAHFNRFMEVHHQSKPRWFELYPIADKAQDLDPEQVFFVDIGGGIGHHTVEMKQRNPQITNRMIVQEMGIVLPTVIKHEGIEAMEHDFLQVQPVKGARCYFLSNIMHDYPDSKAVLILQNIAAAMGPDSVILVNDMVLPNSGAHWHVTQIDITMMTMLAALERTHQQWVELMEKAGLRIQKIYSPAAGGSESVIECVPL